MSLKARVFMSGRSQALRLPAKLRLACPEVAIERMGQGLWLEPCQNPDQSLSEWLEVFYGDHPVLPDAFLADRSDRAPQQRDWS